MADTSKPTSEWLAALASVLIVKNGVAGPNSGFGESSRVFSTGLHPEMTTTEFSNILGRSEKDATS
jgi:hypothetical protein